MLSTPQHCQYQENQRKAVKLLPMKGNYRDTAAKEIYDPGLGLGPRKTTASRKI